jgi:hypothetical protein
MTKAERAWAMKQAGCTTDEIARALRVPNDSARRLVSKGKEKAQPSIEWISGPDVRPDPREKLISATAKSQLFCEDEEDDARETFQADPPQNRRGVRFEVGPKPTEPRKHIVIPDCQTKPGVPLDHLKWAGEYIATQEPDVVVCIGDFYDMESLSEYDRGKKSFEGRRYKADIETGNRAMAMLMEGISKCPKMPRLIFTLGNHEERILRALEMEPRLEGLLGYHDFDLPGWEVYDFLKPVEVDGVHYAHYFTNNVGRPLSGAVETMLRAVGFSFSQGHQQGLRWGRRELANGKAQVGLVAGSFYQHYEPYRGPQGNDHWQGIVVSHEVKDGDWDLMAVSMGYLRRRYGN